MGRYVDGFVVPVLEAELEIYRKIATDASNEKVMQDPRISAFMSADSLPFDTKRMLWGGFQVLVEA